MEEAIVTNIFQSEVIRKNDRRTAHGGKGAIRTLKQGEKNVNEDEIR